MPLPPRHPVLPRGRRAIQPAPRAGRAVAQVVGQFSKRFGAGFGDIAARWNEIVGEKTARMCTPVKLTGRGADGVLHLAAPGPAALLVEADAERILAQVNLYCGRDVAKRLSLTRAPARAKAATETAPRPHAGARGLAPTARLKLEARLADIDDPGLKAALMKLGRATLGGTSGAEPEKSARERKR
jgi:hypothetical protein